MERIIFFFRVHPLSDVVVVWGWGWGGQLLEIVAPPIHVPLPIYAEWTLLPQFFGQVHFLHRDVWLGFINTMFCRIFLT